MIFLLAGTSDARELSLRLQEDGHRIIASVVTESAAKSLNQAGIPSRTGRLSTEEMGTLLREEKFALIVDASHPFAEEASKNAMTAAAEVGIPYIRYERKHTHYEHPLITVVKDYEEAANAAAAKRGVIMLTTGSKTLATFTQVLHNQSDTRLIARMLPRLDNMEKCEVLGVEQRDIVAMQGPFSKELNTALFKQFGVTLIITKESGKVGAVDEKIEAAIECGIETILIARPTIRYGLQFNSFEKVEQAVETILKEDKNGIQSSF